MNNLEKNIQYLWNRQDIPEGKEAWLCLFDYRGLNIHIQFIKHAVSGEYIATCMSPRFQLKHENLRKLMMFVFIHLKHCKDPIIGFEHKKTLDRTLRFFDKLKQEPTLMFPE